MHEIEKKCFNRETAELACYERSYLMDLDNLSLLWVLVVGCQYARDGGAISDEDADKLLKKLWENKHSLIDNKFPNDFFSKDIESFNIEAKGLAFYSRKLYRLPQHCQLIIGVLAQYVRRSQYPERAQMSVENALRSIAEIQSKCVDEKTEL